MTFKERMLEIVEAHPEGITTIDMAVLMGGPYEPDAGTTALRSHICQAGKRLEKYASSAGSTRPGSPGTCARSRGGTLTRKHN